MADAAAGLRQTVAGRRVLTYSPYPYRPDDGREDPDDPGERATRGGHSSPAAHLRSACRGQGLSRAPARGHHNIGFRRVG